jgi:hypothetical protein
MSTRRRCANGARRTAATVLPSGAVIQLNIAFEDALERYAKRFPPEPVYKEGDEYTR